MRIAAVLSSSPVASVQELVSALDLFIARHHDTPVAGLSSIVSLRNAVQVEEQEEENIEAESVIRRARDDDVGDGEEHHKRQKTSVVKVEEPESELQNEEDANDDQDHAKTLSVKDESVKGDKKEKKKEQKEQNKDSKKKKKKKKKKKEKEKKAN
jgi:hypothetical protein